MSELEPNDSRIVTRNPSQTPIEPERTGPRENELRTGAGTPPASPAAKGKDSKDEEERWQVDDAQLPASEKAGTGS